MLGERFTRLPELQEQRQQESAQQALHAEELHRRLAQTRQEAERVARREIDQTNRLQEREMQRHPDWLAWHTEMQEEERQSQNWELNRKSEQKRLRREAEQLRQQMEERQRQIETFMQMEGCLKAEHSRIYQDYEKARQECEAARIALEDCQVRKQENDQKTGPLQTQINSLQGQVRFIDERKPRLLIELEALKKRHQALQGEYQREEQAISGTLQESRQWEDRQMQTALTLNEATRIEQLAAEALEAKQHEYASIQDHVSELTARKERAKELVQSVEHIRDHARNLHGERQRELARVREEERFLLERRDELQRQIDELMRQLHQTNSQLDTKVGRINTLEIEMNELERDQQQSEEHLIQATALLNKVQEQFQQQVEQLSQEAHLIEGLGQKRADAEKERADAEALVAESERYLNDYANRLSSWNSRRLKIQHDLEDTNGRIQQLDLEYNKCLNDLQERQNHLEALFDALKPLLNEQTVIANSFSHLQQQYSATQASVARLEEQIRTFRPISYADRIQCVSAELARLESRYNELQAKLASFENELNPYDQKHRELQVQRLPLEQRIRQTIRSNPPEVLRQQLQREAEAVMRAEAAAGLQYKQERIEQEARELASYQLQRTPRIIIDEEATGNIIDEHLTPSSTYRQIANTVVSMVEQHHIHA